jgi:hypothetical protein
MPEFTLRAHYHREVGAADVCETCRRPLDGVRRPVERFAPGDVVAVDDETEIARLIKAGAIEAGGAPTTEVVAAADADQAQSADGDRPPKAGPKAAWVQYAVSRGFDHAEAEAMTKEDLIASVGD